MELRSIRIHGKSVTVLTDDLTRLRTLINPSHLKQPQKCYNEFSQITPHLYLSNYFSAIDVEQLRAHKIKRVLTVISPREYLIERERYSGIRYKHLAKEDRDWEDMLCSFPDGVSFIEQGVSNDENVLVHCFMGVSRSGSFVLAYLMKTMNWTFDKALKYLREKRKVANPNLGFSLQLKLWEKMQYTLSMSDPEFRNYLLHNLLYLDYPNYFHRMLEFYLNYIETLEKADENLPISTQFGCAACKHPLFKAHNQLQTDRTIRLFQRSSARVSNMLVEARKDCKNFYLEPMQWMSSVLQEFPLNKTGKIRCPSCSVEIGKFMFTSKSYYFCDCIKHLAVSSFVQLIVPCKNVEPVKAKSKLRKSTCC